MISLKDDLGKDKVALKIIMKVRYKYIKSWVEFFLTIGLFHSITEYSII